jgi:DNA-directed RNA polymerase subunit L
MEVKKMESNAEEIQLELKGEGHSFCNALQNFLLKDPAIEFSGYKITHPLVGEPIFNIRTKGKKRPEQSAIDAATALQKELDEIKTTFTKTLATVDAD